MAFIEDQKYDKSLLKMLFSIIKKGRKLKKLSGGIKKIAEVVKSFFANPVMKKTIVSNDYTVVGTRIDIATGNAGMETFGDVIQDTSTGVYYFQYNTNANNTVNISLNFVGGYVQVNLINGNVEGNGNGGFPQPAFPANILSGTVVFDFDNGTIGVYDSSGVAVAAPYDYVTGTSTTPAGAASISMGFSPTSSVFGEFFFDPDTMPYVKPAEVASGLPVRDKNLELQNVGNPADLDITENGTLATVIATNIPQRAQGDVPIDIGTGDVYVFQFDTDMEADDAVFLGMESQDQSERVFLIPYNLDYNVSSNIEGNSASPIYPACFRGTFVLDTSAKTMVVYDEFGNIIGSPFGYGNLENRLLFPFFWSPLVAEVGEYFKLYLDLDNLPYTLPAGLPANIKPIGGTL